ncbi:MAG TPA: hypothetical protein VN238_20515 [Solirubrobacteraceae bacterium]|nr:hypothetical protein [Solirubrobacteraceae bacterium]
MSPYYGNNPPPDGDLVPDWLLGGNRKRRVLQALAAPPDARGWLVADLADELECGRTTVFEIVRALRPLGVVQRDAQGRVHLDSDSELGGALIGLLRAVRAVESVGVDRPPRARDAHRDAA